MREQTTRENWSKHHFGTFLRTGRRIEIKFNPYHDPKDGRFTFGPGGTMTGSSRSRASDRRSDNGSYGVSDPRHPSNHALHNVRHGDTLGSIAASRHGIKAGDIAWLNGIDPRAPLRIGQQIKVPNQRYLDAARDAKNTTIALDYYMRSHGGEPPPNVRHPPSLEQQILGPQTWHAEHRNGYTYQIDLVGRPHAISGVITRNVDQVRSKLAQARAGGKDRLPTDHDGHYIARRFNGPTDAFNHFAQDANFNRGAYRQMENEIDALAQIAPTKIRIAPHYPPLSMRPDRIEVIYGSRGARHVRNFANRRSGK